MLSVNSQQLVVPKGGDHGKQAAIAGARASVVESDEIDARNVSTLVKDGAGPRASRNAGGGGEGHAGEGRQASKGTNVRQAWGDTQEESARPQQEVGSETPLATRKEQGARKNREGLQGEGRPGRDGGAIRRNAGDDHGKEAGDDDATAEHSRQSGGGGDSPEAERRHTQVRRPKKKGVNRWVLSKREELLNGASTSAKADGSVAGGGHSGVGGANGAGAGTGDDASTPSTRPLASVGRSAPRGDYASAGARAAVDVGRGADGVQERRGGAVTEGPGGNVADVRARGTYTKQNRRGERDAERERDTHNVSVGEGGAARVVSPTGAKTEGVGGTGGSQGSKTSGKVSDGHAHPRVAKARTQASTQGSARHGADAKSAANHGSAVCDGDGVCCFWGVERLDLPVEIRSFLCVLSCPSIIVMWPCTLLTCSEKRQSIAP